MGTFFVVGYTLTTPQRQCITKYIDDGTKLNIDSVFTTDDVDIS